MTTEIPPRRVREAPIAYRSEGGIRIEHGGPPNATERNGGGTLWLSYLDAFLLHQDLKTALKGIDIKEKQ